MKSPLGLGRDILVYGLGDLAAKAIGFFTMPVYTRLLTPAEFGTLNTIGAATGLVANLTNLGMSSGVQRYYFAPGTDKPALLATGLIGLAGWSLLLLAAGLLLSLPVSLVMFGTDDARVLIMIALVAVPFIQIFAYCQDAQRLLFRPWTFVFIGLCSQLMLVAVTLLLVVVLRLGLTGFFLASIIAMAAATLIGLATLRLELSAQFRPDDLKRLVRFGAPLILASLSTSVFVFANRAILSHYAGLEQTGILAVAVAAVTMLSVFGSAFARAWSPLAMRMLQEDPDHRTVFATILLYMLSGYAVLALSLAVFAPEVVRLLAPRSYAGAADIVPILAFGAVATASTYVTALGIVHSGRTLFFAAIYWPSAALNLLLDILLVRYGALGVAVASTVTEIGVALVVAVVGTRLYPLPYRYRELALLAGLLAIFVLGTYTLPPVTDLTTLVAKAAYVAAFAAAALLLKIIDAQLIRKLVRKIAESISLPP